MEIWSDVWSLVGNQKISFLRPTFYELKKKKKKKKRAISIFENPNGGPEGDTVVYL